MELITERQEGILRYLFEKNQPVPFKEIVNTLAPKFDVSKDTIRLDLEDLIKKSLVERPSRGLYKNHEKWHELSWCEATRAFL